MVLERLRLDGRVAIVTGGSHGLGKEMARSLAEAGAAVVIASRGVERLEAAAGELREATGGRILAVPTDVAASAQCDALVERTVAALGRLDILVNNAGVGDRRGSASAIWELSDNDWADGLAVNLSGTFYCTRAAARIFRKQGAGGAILNISSGMALRAPAPVAYSAAKAGVIALTKVSASQLIGDGVRVNCIVPGFLLQEAPPTPEAVAQAAARGRLNTSRRLGEAWEMGPLAVYLCSDASSYVTGQSFAIDGGGLAGGIAPTGMAPEMEPARA